MFPTAKTLHYRSCPPAASQHVNQQYLGWYPPFPTTVPREHQTYSQENINNQLFSNRSFNNSILYTSSLNNYEDVPKHVSSNRTTNDSWDAYSRWRSVTNPRPVYNPAPCQYSSYSLNQHVRERSPASFSAIETSAFMNHQHYATQPSNAVPDHQNPQLLADRFRTSRHILENFPSAEHFIQKDLGFLNDRQRHCNPFPQPSVSHEKAAFARWPPSMPCAPPMPSVCNQNKTAQNRVKGLPQTASHLLRRQLVGNSQGRESVVPSAWSDRGYASVKPHHDALNQLSLQTASCLNSHVSQYKNVGRSEHDSAICSINQYTNAAGSEQLGNSAYRHASLYVNARGSEQYHGNSTFKDLPLDQTPRMVSSVPDIMDSCIDVQSNLNSQMFLGKQFSCSSKADFREIRTLLKKGSGTNAVGKHGLLERNKITETTHLCQGVQQLVKEKDVDVMRDIYHSDKTCRQTTPISSSLLVVQSTDQETDVVGESFIVTSDKGECSQLVQIQSESTETMKSTSASHPTFCEKIYPGKPHCVDNISQRIKEGQRVFTSGHSKTHIEVVDVKKESKAMAFHPASEVRESEINMGLSNTNAHNNSLDTVISHQDEFDILIIDLYDDVDEDINETKDSSNKMKTSQTQEGSHHKRDHNPSWDEDSPKCSALHKNNDCVNGMKDTVTNLVPVSEPLPASSTSPADCSRDIALVADTVLNTSNHPADCNKGEMKTHMLTMAETFLSFNCGSIKDSNMLSPSSAERDMLSPVSSEIDFSCKASFDQICSGRYVVLEAQHSLRSDVLEAQHSLRSDECDLDTTTESQSGTSFANAPKIMNSHCVPLQCPGGTETEELGNLKSRSDPDLLQQQQQYHLCDNKDRTFERQIPRSDSDQRGCGTAKLKTIELKRRHSDVEQCIYSSKLKILSSGQIFRVKKRRVTLFAQKTVMCDKDNTAKTQEILGMNPEDTSISCEGQRGKHIINATQKDDDSKTNCANVNKQLLAPYQVLPKDHMPTMSSSEMETIAELSDLPEHLQGSNGSQGTSLSSKDDCTAHSAHRMSTIHRPKKALKKDRDIIVALHKDTHRPFGVHRLMPFSLKPNSNNHLICLKCKILFSCKQKFLQHQLLRHAHFIIK